MQQDRSSEERMIDAALRAWRFNADRIDAFFNALSQNQLEQEIAPGRNRLIYLWGHIAAVNDGLFPLLGLGPKLYPEMEAMFIANPDRAAVTIYSAEQVKRAWSHINEELFAGLSGWSPMEWLERHTAVSVDDFLQEPHRNRYTVVLSRNTHMAYHFGQALSMRVDREQAEQEFVAAKMVLDEIPDAILFVDRMARLKHVNKVGQITLDKGTVIRRLLNGRLEIRDRRADQLLAALISEARGGELRLSGGELGRFVIRVQPCTRGPGGSDNGIMIIRIIDLGRNGEPPTASSTA